MINSQLSSSIKYQVSIILIITDLGEGRPDPVRAAYLQRQVRYASAGLCRPDMMNATNMPPPRGFVGLP
ncbi:Uncharacterized protein dnm_034080 [Desulfonema magnum]|uniref:Uncharacterized protein n=1 Tax=Desulfonema magnum TaxID=45655 RepID=A0A975GN42_9BACT|nr:Uncharacterized protein dnm_034080 [Desulfonema magnum]